MTNTQIIANLLFVLYAIWEILVQILEINIPLAGAFLRIDLLIIYPVLLILVIIATLQYLNKKDEYKAKKPLFKEIEKI